MKSAPELFAEMWTDYCRLSPAAARVYQLLQQRGETIVNDHIALRTIRGPRVGLDQVAVPFERHGYRAKQDYVFEAKKLYAKHWEHPDPMMPKIFISELEIEKFPTNVQEIFAGLLAQVPANATNDDGFFISGRPWKLSHATYLSLANISEYASWVAAFGFRPNHFTVLVNQLKTFKDLQSLNVFLKGSGFQLNTAGGEIKGTPAELLEQSSTLAEEIDLRFDDGIFRVPSVYYEFARRYPQTDGRLYSGFIAKSADKIFESTDRRG